MRGERRGADERRARRAGRRRDSHSLYTHVRRGSRTHTCLVSSEFVTPLRSRGTGGLGISISFFIVFDFILCVGHLRERRDLESDTSRCSDLAWVSHRISQGPRSACSAQQPSRERPAAARTAMFSPLRIRRRASWGAWPCWARGPCVGVAAYRSVHRHTAWDESRIATNKTKSHNQSHAPHARISADGRSTSSRSVARRAHETMSVALRACPPHRAA